MIDANLIVDASEEDYVEGLCGKDFEIIGKRKVGPGYPSKKFYWFFHIRATNEDISALILKYGRDKAWIR